MSNVDMRNLMETIERGEQVDEAGGIIDKGLSAFGNKGAKGRVDVEKERKSILDGWKEFAGAQGYDNKDAAGFEKFLAHWNFDRNEMDDIISDPFNLDDSLLKAARMQYMSRKGVTGAERGGPIENKPKGDDNESIMRHFSKVLGGNAAILQAEFNEIKNVKQLGNDELAMTGWSYMKAGHGSPTKGKK